VITISYTGLNATVCGSATPTLTLTPADTGGSVDWTPATGMQKRCLPANIRAVTGV
jgi:hypothetical protein